MSRTENRQNTQPSQSKPDAGRKLQCASSKQYSKAADAELPSPCRQLVESNVPPLAVDHTDAPIETRVKVDRSTISAFLDLNNCNPSMISSGQNA